MRTWIYLQNPFLTATDGNYKLAAKISLYHKNALQAGSADAFIGPLNTAYATPNTNLQNAYSAWEAAGGAQKGKTLTVTQLLKQAKAKLDVFEPPILLQMKTHLKSNKKVFARRSMGFINDFISKPELYKQIMK